MKNQTNQKEQYPVPETKVIIVKMCSIIADSNGSGETPGEQEL